MLDFSRTLSYNM